MPKLRFGSKNTSKRHTATITREVINLLKKLAKIEGTRISTGRINLQAGRSPTKYSFKMITGGIKIIVRHEGKKQEITVYTKNPKIVDNVKETVKKNFS